MAAASPPTDKIGRCIGHSSLAEIEAFKDIKCLLRDGEGNTDNETSSGDTKGLACSGRPNRRLSEDNTVSATDSTISNQSGGSRERALKTLRRDLEDSRGLGRTDPYRKARLMRQSGRARSFDDASSGGGEVGVGVAGEAAASASEGPPSPVGGIHQDSSSSGSYIHSQDPRYWFSDDDTFDNLDDKSYSSTNSSLFWNKHHYDTNNVPSILVSGTDGNIDAATNSSPAHEMDAEYPGSTAVYQPQHAGRLLSLLNVMRESEDRVDITVSSTGLSQPLSGHRAVLAAGSPYFANLIENCSDVKSLKTLNLEIKDLRTDLISQLVDFIYDGHIVISKQNAPELLQQAYSKNLFQGKSVELACSEFLTGQVLLETGSDTSSTAGIASSVFSLEHDDGQSSSSSPECCYHDRNYPMDILCALNKQRQQKQLTDLVLRVEGVDFYCHRAILIALSPYFRAMLTSDMRESAEKEVVLYDINLDIFTRLMHFVYTCRLYLNENNAQDVMELACFFQLNPAMSACSQFLKDQLAISNCFGILSFAYYMNCSELYNAAMDFVRSDFVTASSISDEFQDLEAAILSDMIADDHLNVAKEESVFEAVMTWLRSNSEIRLPVMPSVLSNVRLPLMDPPYFHTMVENDELLKQSPECEEVIKMAKELRQQSLRGDISNDPRLKLRFSMKTEVGLVLIVLLQLVSLHRGQHVGFYTNAIVQF